MEQATHAHAYTTAFPCHKKSPISCRKHSQNRKQKNVCMFLLSCSCRYLKTRSRVINLSTIEKKRKNSYARAQQCYLIEVLRSFTVTLHDDWNRTRVCLPTRHTVRLPFLSVNTHSAWPYRNLISDEWESMPFECTVSKLNASQPQSVFSLLGFNPPAETTSGDGTLPFSV